jgi:SWI/SNF-related matrix-associated actin-dependent regulator of chromatin subfamily A-like protein 1
LTLSLLPFQHTGAEFLVSKPRSALHDEMGVGKTAQAISACDRIGAFRIVVVCPAAVRQVWHGEFKKFAVIPRKILKARTIHDLGVWLKGRADVLLLSYELASKWHDKIAGDLFDVLIFDEAHYLKNPQSQRTRNMLGTNCDGASGLARWAARVWFLTGTPIPNDPVDIWPWLRFVGGTSLTQAPFTARYFKSRMGTFSSTQTPRDELIPELKMALDAFRLKRTKKQVGLQLPPIHLTTVTVDGDTSEIVSLLKEWPGLEDAILEALDQGGLSFLDAQHIATLRRLVGEAKAPAYAQLVAEEFRNGREKLVIFTMHTRAAEIIATHLNNEGFAASIFDGGTSERMRAEHIASFQNDPSHRAFIGNIKAAGTGQTLTAAADLDMFESSWAPADNAQAIMRVHRIGQTAGRVNARFISLAKSIDETVSEVVARKTASIAKIENYGEEAA